MDRKNGDTENPEFIEEYPDEIAGDEDLDDADGSGIPEYYFSNPDPYAKIEPRPAHAPRHDFHFDGDGNIVVKNPSAFWLQTLKSWKKQAARNLP